MSDASPIIALSSIGELDLLRRLFGTVQIPTAVKREIMAERREDIRDGIARGWIIVKEATANKTVERLRVKLGAGEAEAIALASESPDTLLLVDDRLARRKAEARGVMVAGTLGILAVAAKRGLVADLEGLVKLLADRGFWVSERVTSEVIARGRAR